MGGVVGVVVKLVKEVVEQLGLGDAGCNSNAGVWWYKIRNAKAIGA
jgi:hypothetical protein